MLGEEKKRCLHSTSASPLFLLGTGEGQLSFPLLPVSNKSRICPLTAQMERGEERRERIAYYIHLLSLPLERKWKWKEEESGSLRPPLHGLPHTFRILLWGWRGKGTREKAPEQTERRRRVSSRHKRKLALISGQTSDVFDVSFSLGFFFSSLCTTFDQYSLMLWMHGYTTMSRPCRGRSSCTRIRK